MNFHPFEYFPWVRIKQDFFDPRFKAIDAMCIEGPIVFEDVRFLINLLIKGESRVRFEV